MKKISVLILAAVLAAVLIAGCGKGKVEKRTDATADNSSFTQEQTTPSEAETKEPENTKAAITNDKPVKLYEMDYSTNTARLVNSVGTDWDPGADIGTFGAFIDEGDEISFDSEITTHQMNWDMVNTATEYKIGYEILFELDGEKIDIPILDPADIEDSEYLFMGDADSGDVTGYLGVWVYDDYNQEGGFYIHITSGEVNDDTLLTSIKLRPTPQSEEISNLKLRVFSYPAGLEFDEIKQYNNEYGYEVSIG